MLIKPVDTQCVQNGLPFSGQGLGGLGLGAEIRNGPKDRRGEL